jgi:bifunctional non-homologous end joining protein LigD
VPNASAALEWKEVNHKLHPSQFNIQNMTERLEKKHDLFSKVLTTTNNIQKALKLLNA